MVMVVIGKKRYTKTDMICGGQEKVHIYLVGDGDGGGRERVHTDLVGILVRFRGCLGRGA